MEAIGAVERGDWSSSDMSGIGLCIAEESDFIVHLHAANSCASNELNASANLRFSSSWFNMVSAIDDEASYYSSECCCANLHKFSHSGGLLMDPPHPSIFSIDLCLENMRSKHSCYQDRGDDRLLSETNSHDVKRIEFESAILENLKKPSLSLKNASKTRNPRPKKSPKLIRFSTNYEEDGNGDTNEQSTSNCNSEDDSNAPQESIPKRHKSLDITGKTRATRGSATDPQSLNTRRRRERINQRLRTLQSLVPNGTKVNISTMLEEAVQYVKFLQLQIKLLSSDDQWMYAPIAYNGMDLGLNTMQSERRNGRWC